MHKGSLAYNKCVLLVLIFIFPLFSVAAETGSDAGEVTEVQEQAAYVIRNVSYEIDGRTRKEVLSHILKIKKGSIFKDSEELRVYLEDKEQVIANQRMLAEGEILASYEPAGGDAPAATYVDLMVKVRDTWNLVLLPYGKYDSNEGLQLSLKGRDYNFLGGMQTLELNLDYIMRDLSQAPDTYGSDFTLDTNFEVPFYSYGLNWNIGFKGDVTYNTEEADRIAWSGAPLEVNAETSLGLDVPLDRHTWKTELVQEYHLHEDGLDDPDQYYLGTTLRFGSAIPTGLKLPLCKEITYAPSLFASFNYKPGDSLSKDRKGYETGFKHGISAGRIDWIGNFRTGTKLSLSNTIKWNYTRERWLGDASGEYELHSQWGWGGLSSRAGFFYEYGYVKESAGDKIRGILDNRIEGDLGLYSNVELPTKMWIWFLDRWFEGHISPFFDYAVVSPKGEGLDFNDAWYGAGIEAFAYAKFARSLYLRISLGFDMQAVLEDGEITNPAERDGGTPYEIFIGLGHHY